MIIVLVSHVISPAINKLRVLGDPHGRQQAKQAEHPSLWPPTSQTHNALTQSRCLRIIVINVRCQWAHVMQWQWRQLTFTVVCSEHMIYLRRRRRYGCVVLFTGWFHRCIRLEYSDASLMHRWNQPVNKTTHRICFRPHARARLSVCLSVCLCARLLKNACMDLDKMLRVDRCRDMDELINFWARSGCRNRKNRKIDDLSKSVKQAPHSKQATGHVIQTGSEWHVDCGDLVKIETRYRIPIWRASGRIPWLVIPQPPATLQDAATWRSQCHDPRATCHIAGCCHRVNYTACHPRATYHIEGCCQLVNSLSRFQSHMPHCRV